MSQEKIGVVLCLIMIAILLPCMKLRDRRKNRRCKLTSPFADDRDSIARFRKIYGRK